MFWEAYERARKRTEVPRERYEQENKRDREKREKRDRDK